MVEKGADVNYIEPPSGYSKAGYPPLMNAMIFCNPAVVEYLLEKGANACYEEAKGREPLYYARAQ